MFFRSFLVGLLLSFGVMCGVGLWLTSRKPEPEPVRAPAPAPSAAPAPGAAQVRAPARVLLHAERNLAARPLSAALVVPAVASPEEADLKAAIASAVREGEDRPTGTVNGETIRAAIKSVKPLVTQCFQDARDRYPPPQKVVMGFNLKGGRFSGGKVMESTVTDPWLESCLLDSLLDARFPAGADEPGVSVTYPFRFEPAAR